MEAGQKYAVCSFAHRKAGFQRANAFAQSVAKFGHAIFLLGERPRQIVFDHADQLVRRLAQRAIAGRAQALQELRQRINGAHQFRIARPGDVRAQAFAGVAQRSARAVVDFGRFAGNRCV